MAAWNGASDGLLRGMTGLGNSLGLRHYTEQKEPQEYVQAAGIGVQLAQGRQDDGLRIKTVARDGAASRSGVVSENDVLLEVDGLSLVGKRWVKLMRRIRRGRFRLGHESDMRPPLNSFQPQGGRQATQGTQRQPRGARRAQKQQCCGERDVIQDSPGSGRGCQPAISTEHSPNTFLHARYHPLCD
jgi:hypothetical protein